ncbi:hypothetical protein HDU91_001388 [Kappamyces sp. JEL0680]|nr:hypothetical protein HDU91_001388 [Kappamyces sp. JEL0680]
MQANKQVSQKSVSLYPGDVMVYRNKADTPQTFLEVTSATDCTPVAGGIKFGEAPKLGSALQVFDKPGTFYISTVESCTPSPDSTIVHTVNALPVNPYAAMAAQGIAQIKAQKELIAQLKQQSSSALALSSSLVLTLVAAAAML